MRAMVYALLGCFFDDVVDYNVLDWGLRGRGRGWLAMG